MEKSNFIKLMKKIKASYGDRFQDLSIEVLEVWYECMGCLDDDKLNKALANYMTVNKFPPTIADLKEKYDALAEIERKKELEVKRLYDWTVALYPNAHYEDGLHEVYMGIMAEYPIDEQIQLAQQILNRVSVYVREVEASSDSSIMPLVDYLKGEKWRD